MPDKFDLSTISELKDPAIFLALKRMSQYVSNSVWDTSSSDLDYEYAKAKSKEYAEDIKLLAAIDEDIAYGQIKNKVGKGFSIRQGGDFNPWYTGRLTLVSLLNSLGWLVDVIEATSPRYLPEAEFLHYYYFLQDKLQPPFNYKPTVIRFEDLHEKIKKHCEDRFDNSQYSDAILAAYKVVFNEIKDVAGIYDLDGKPLIEKVFSLNNPIIKLNELITQSDRDEQQGFMMLFSGAAMGIRNPKAHNLVNQEDELRTLYYLAFASLLLERLDERKSP